MTNVTGNKGPSPLVWSKTVTTGNSRFTASVFIDHFASRYGWRVERFVDDDKAPRGERIASGTASKRLEAKEQVGAALDEAVNLEQGRHRLE